MKKFRCRKKKTALMAEQERRRAVARRELAVFKKKFRKEFAGSRQAPEAEPERKSKPVFLKTVSFCKMCGGLPGYSGGRGTKWQ